METNIPTMSGKELVEKLDSLYPKVKTPLSHSNTFQLLIATILSAQCTDAQVNKVTPPLFQKYPDAPSMARAQVRHLEHLVKSTGFYHVKARRIKLVSQKIVSNFEGKVPETMDDLLTLPGIGRKTANIVLSAGYGKIDGIAVDTHVFRVSRRIGLAKSNTPEKIEQELMQITPKDFWPRLSMLLIFHGRRTCFARNPNCESCILRSKCLYFQQGRKI
ncbi:MAG: endonuclease III [Nitrososphaerales archaeon]